MEHTSAQTIEGGDAAELAIIQGLPLFDNSEPLSNPIQQPAPVEPQAQQQPVEPVNAEDPAQPAEPVTPENQDDDDDGLLDLDGILNPTASPAEPANDPFVELYEKYKIEEKGKDGIEKFIEAKTQEIETLRKAQEEIFADDSLKTANEIAKNLGKAEALEYLGLAQYNYDEVDDPTLIKWDLEARNGFKPEEVDEYLESLTDVQRRIQGAKVRNELKTEQASRIAKYELEATQAAQARTKAMSEALASINQIEGVKVNNEDRQRIAKIVTSDEFKSKYGLSIDSKADMKKAVQAVAMLELFPKVLKVAQQKNVTAGKAEVLRNLSNAQPNNNPTPQNAGKQLSEFDQHMSDLQGGKGLLSMF